VAPDIPTVDDAGLPGFHLSLWHALWAPKRTSKDVIGKLNAAVAHTLADPAVRQRLDQLVIHSLRIFEEIQGTITPYGSGLATISKTA